MVVALVVRLVVVVGPFVVVGLVVLVVAVGLLVVVVPSLVVVVLRQSMSSALAGSCSGNICSGRTQTLDSLDSKCSIATGTSIGKSPLLSTQGTAWLVTAKAYSRALISTDQARNIVF